MEFALVTLIFLGLGLGLDALLGTRPVCAIGFVVFAFVGQFVKLRYTYSATMERLEAEREAMKAAPRATVAPATSLANDSLPTGVVLDESPSA